MGKLGRFIGYQSSDKSWHWSDCFYEQFAEDRLPKSSFQKGCDVAVPELLIMTVVKIGGEAYRAEMRR